jgi:hypothetical protein
VTKTNIALSLASTLIVILVVIFLEFGRAQTQTECDATDPTFQNTDSWQIDASTIDATILWQKTEQRPKATAFVGTPNSGITASQFHVVYMWISEPTTCTRFDQTELVAFDLHSGDEMWHVKDHMQLFRRISSIDGAYILISDDHSVFKLDLAGNIIWENSEIPSRSVETAYQLEDSIYVPSWEKIYQMAAETGEITNEFELEHLLGATANYAVLQTNREQLEVLDFKNNVSLFALRTPFIVDFENAAFNLVPFAESFGNILVTYTSSFTPTHIEAYDTTSGESLWSIDSSFYCPPIKLGDSIATYGRNGLQVFGAQDGRLLGQLSLKRTGDEDVEDLSRVWIAGYGNVVVIYYRDLCELIVLEIDFNLT